MASNPPLRIRGAEATDVAALAQLLHAYMLESYSQPWRGTPEALARDVFGQQFSLLVAADPRQSLLGFLAWIPSYDLHHCVAGGEVLDLYVEPRHRGRGIALLLGCAAAARVFAEGGTFLKGSAVETGPGRRLYRRFAVSDAAGYIVAGRGFRRLAGLAGRPIREVARRLPEPSWSCEA